MSTAWNPIKTATVKGRGVPSLLCQHLQKDKNDTILAVFYKLHDAKGVFMLLHLLKQLLPLLFELLTAFRQYS